jgi:hypothetical protein
VASHRSFRLTLHFLLAFGNRTCYADGHGDGCNVPRAQGHG